MSSVTAAERALAKINLFLHVGERRADGYHPLQSLVVFTEGAEDMVRAETAPLLTLDVDGPFAGALAGEADNLVLRAARALAAEAGTLAGAHLTLTKNLPVASGIGGGSADAAAALRAMQALWKTETDLTAIAAMLGSDIPVCVEGVPAFMEGRGEILTQVESFPRLAMLLVNPGVAVPTGPVYGALQARSGADGKLPPGRFQDCADLLRFLETTKNDLEAPARAQQPVIGEVLTALAGLPGALFTRMSGSGATCFAIFPDDDSCARAAKMLGAVHTDWWIAPTCVAQHNITREERGQDIGPTPDGL